ncbi:MAG: hypothetical protein KC561_02085, partial [Myxococcales bacterium]|nr:hypothetical protein [Myxococcales bacterium]
VENTVLQGSVDVTIDSARYAQAGILYAPDAPWSIGLAFRQDYHLRLGIGTLVTGDVVLDSNPNNPVTVVEDGTFIFDSFNANLFTPMQLVLGGSYDFGPLLVSLDIGWYRWSQFPAPTATVDIDIDLDTLDFTIPPLEPVQAPEFSDIIVPRIGFELDTFESPHVAIQSRLGYFFEDTPAPAQSGFTNYADSAKHALSLGFGFSFSDFTEVLPKPLHLDLTFLYIRMTEREYEKDNPADLIGDYRIDGHIFGFSTLLGFEL